MTFSPKTLQDVVRFPANPKGPRIVRALPCRKQRTSLWPRRQREPHHRPTTVFSTTRAESSCNPCRAASLAVSIESPIPGRERAPAYPRGSPHSLDGPSPASNNALASRFCASGTSRACLRVRDVTVDWRPTSGARIAHGNTRAPERIANLRWLPRAETPRRVRATRLQPPCSPSGSHFGGRIECSAFSEQLFRTDTGV